MKGLWLACFWIIGLYFVTIANSNNFICKKQKKSLVINVGICCDYPPFEYITKTGNIAGKNKIFLDKLLEIYGANNKKYNLSIKYHILSFEEGFFLLENGGIDIFAGSATATAEREKRFVFLCPIFTTEMCILSRNSYPKKLGVQIGSLQEEYAENNLSCELIRAITISDLIFLYSCGRVDGIIINDAAYKFFLKKNNIKGEVTIINGQEYIGFAMRKNKILGSKFDHKICNQLILTFNQYKNSIIKELPSDMG